MPSITVELLDNYGNDLTVVNAARVSFENHHDEFDPKADASLIGYLAQHNHWTPFAHPQATFRISCPIPIARQQFKSTVGFIYSEVSRRYVSSTPKFFRPTAWRSAPTNGAKQGSGDVMPMQMYPIYRYDDSCKEGLEVYNDLLGHGVAPELARLALPQGMMTTFIVTGSLAAWARFCNQRLDSHAQAEVRTIATEVHKLMSPLYPFSWQELVGDMAFEKGESLEVISAVLRTSPGCYMHEAFSFDYDDFDPTSYAKAMNEWACRNNVELDHTLLDEIATDEQYEEISQDIRLLSKFDFSRLVRQGWRIMAIQDTEDGPVIVRARPLSVSEKLSTTGEK